MVEAPHNDYQNFNGLNFLLDTVDDINNGRKVDCNKCNQILEKILTYQTSLTKEQFDTEVFSLLSTVMAFVFKNSPKDKRSYNNLIKLNNQITELCNTSIDPNDLDFDDLVDNMSTIRNLISAVFYAPDEETIDDFNLITQVDNAFSKAFKFFKPYSRITQDKFIKATSFFMNKKPEDITLEDIEKINQIIYNHIGKNINILKNSAVKKLVGKIKDKLSDVEDYIANDYDDRRVAIEQGTQLIENIKNTSFLKTRLDKSLTTNTMSNYMKTLDQELVALQQRFSPNTTLLVLEHLEKFITECQFDRFLEEFTNIECLDNKIIEKINDFKQILTEIKNTKMHYYTPQQDDFTIPAWRELKNYNFETLKKRLGELQDKIRTMQQKDEEHKKIEHFGKFSDWANEFELNDIENIQHFTTTIDKYFNGLVRKNFEANEENLKRTLAVNNKLLQVEHYLLRQLNSENQFLQQEDIQQALNSCQKARKTLETFFTDVFNHNSFGTDARSAKVLFENLANNLEQYPHDKFTQNQLNGQFYMWMASYSISTHGSRQAQNYETFKEILNKIEKVYNQEIKPNEVSSNNKEPSPIKAILNAKEDILIATKYQSEHPYPEDDIVAEIDHVYEALIVQEPSPLLQSNAMALLNYHIADDYLEERIANIKNPKVLQDMQKKMKAIKQTISKMADEHQKKVNVNNSTERQCELTEKEIMKTKGELEAWAYTGLIMQLGKMTTEEYYKKRKTVDEYRFQLDNPLCYNKKEIENKIQNIDLENEILHNILKIEDLLGKQIKQQIKKQAEKFKKPKTPKKQNFQSRSNVNREQKYKPKYEHIKREHPKSGIPTNIGSTRSAAPVNGWGY